MKVPNQDKAMKQSTQSFDRSSGHTIYTQDTFWARFIDDLRMAKALVLIQSPFLSDRRLNEISDILVSLISRGVTVCVFIQEPLYWRTWRTKDALSPEIIREIKATENRIKRLQSLDVHVNLRSNIHEKLAVIDDFVIWDGSLNMLSHTRTKERVHRFTEREKIQQAIELHKLSCEICKELRLRYGSPKSAPDYIKQLLSYRARLKLTQMELAKRCGIHQSRLSRLQQPAPDMNLSGLLRIAQELDVQPILIPKILVPTVTGLLARFFDGESPRPTGRRPRIKR